MRDKQPTHMAQPRCEGTDQWLPKRPSERGFEQTVGAMWEHLDLLQQRAAADAGVVDAVLSEAFEELRIALEELRVAEEEWHQQSCELGSTRQILEEERRRYQELFDFAPYGYVLTDAAAVIRQANRAAATLLNVPQDLLPGKPLALFVAPGERRVFYTHLNQLPCQEQQKQVVDWELRLQPRQSRPLYAALTVAIVRECRGNIVGLRWLMHDITERKMVEAKAQQVERALRSSREQLRALTTHLQNRQEEERRRIARAIHDELGQALTVLNIDLAWLSARMPATDATGRERLRDMTAMVDTLLTSVRRIGTELRPDILDDLGLTAAIEWQLQEICKRTGLTYRLSTPAAEVVLTQTHATAIFRIFQEALTNILRHAAARKISVRLSRRPDVLILTIADDGRGITPGQLDDRHSLGLLSMRERAYLLGGEVVITGAAGKGTTVTLRMPYQGVATAETLR
jgi:PAS domain S-box-containing protein